MKLINHAGEWYRIVAAEAICVKNWYKSSFDRSNDWQFIHWKFHIRRLNSLLESYVHGSKHWTYSKSLSLNIEATCLLLSSPRNIQYEMKVDKYGPCPSMISMLSSDSQHPPRSRNVVHLGVYVQKHALATYYLFKLMPIPFEDHDENIKGNSRFKRQLAVTYFHGRNRERERNSERRRERV